MTQRFYPDFILPFANEPTRNNFSIKKYNDKIGLAVYSKQRFYKGDLVFKFSGVKTEKITQYSLQYSHDRFIHDPWFMGFVSHKCEPNCIVDMKTLEFIAVTDIQVDERVTMNYNQTEDYLYRTFHCECGENKCSYTQQKEIFGNKWSEDLNFPDFTNIDKLRSINSVN